jgi:hypothetical protein
VPVEGAVIEVEVIEVEVGGGNFCAAKVGDRTTEEEEEKVRDIVEGTSSKG